MSAKSVKRKTTASVTGGWEQMLKAVPMPNEAARVTSEDLDGTITVTVPTRAKRFLFPPISWVIRPPKERQAVLDPLGATIWRACNGNRTVEEIVDNFAFQHRLSFHESRVSVTSYIKALLQRGALAVAVPDREA